MNFFICVFDSDTIMDMVHITPVG